MSDIITFVTGQKRKKKKKKRKRSTKYCLSVFRKNDLISWKKNNVRTRSKESFPVTPIFVRTSVSNSFLR